VRFGDNPLAERVFHEQYVQTAMGNVAIPPNVVTVYTIGNFTMPFAGRATVSMWARFEWWDSNGYFEVSMSDQSTPPPTATMLNGWQDGHPGATFGSKADVPSYATWNGLTKGQVVTMKARIYAGAVTPQLDYLFAFVRMYRA
jgi:hypothetical protein